MLKYKISIKINNNHILKDNYHFFQPMETEYETKILILLNVDIKLFKNSISKPVLFDFHNIFSGFLDIGVFVFIFLNTKIIFSHAIDTIKLQSKTVVSFYIYLHVSGFLFP